MGWGVPIRTRGQTLWYSRYIQYVLCGLGKRRAGGRVKEACVTPAGYQESLLSLFSRKGETREGSRAEQGREGGRWCIRSAEQ